MANQARQSPPESINNSNNNHTTSPVSNSVHNASTPYYHHHYHTASAAGGAGNNPGSNAGYSPPQNGGLNGNESPSSVDQFSSNNNIQLPETPNSLVTTMMGPTSGNSNSNDGTNAINESENATIIANNNNNYSPWCTATSGHHQLPLNNSPIHSSSYNSAHPSLYSAAAAHHNLLPHQNISSFVQHPQKGFNHHLSQPFYSWY
jgi:hypothetical protein